MVEIQTHPQLQHLLYWVVNTQSPKNVFAEDVTHFGYEALKISIIGFPELFGGIQKLFTVMSVFISNLASGIQVCLFLM